MNHDRTIAPRGGFLDAPIELDPARWHADAIVLGVPYGVPYPHSGATDGCADAPAAVRERSARLARWRGNWDFDLDGPMLAVGRPHVVDGGDVPGSPDDGPGNARRAEAVVRVALAAGAVPIVIGGDDSVPIPILRAYEGRGPLTVLQLDAHLDFRDEVAGVRDGYSSPMRRASELPHVARLVQVGLRGVGSARPADVADARAAGSLLVTARELRERGVTWLIDELAPAASVFVCFDLDGLDPGVCAAVSAPSPGGLSYREADELLAGIGPRLAGAAFTELVPGLDRGGIGALVVARLMIRLLAGLG